MAYSIVKLPALLFAGGIVAFRTSIRKSMQVMRSISRSPLKITVLGSDSDESCLTVLSRLPSEALVVSQGPSLDALVLKDPDCVNSEVLLVASGNPAILSEVMRAMKNLKWVHGIFAGLDHMRCPEFDNSSDNGIIVTNAKGVFSSSLAEVCDLYLHVIANP